MGQEVELALAAYAPSTLPAAARLPILVPTLPAAKEPLRSLGSSAR